MELTKIKISKATKEQAPEIARGNDGRVLSVFLW